MKKFLFAFLLLPFFVFSQKTTVKQAEPAKPSFTITGTITGLAEGDDVKLINGNDNKELASAKVIKGKFQLKGSVDEPVLSLLNIGKEKPQYLFVENKKVTITGKKTALKDLKVTGSPTHQDFVQFQEVFNPLFAQLNTTVTTLNKTLPGVSYDALMKKYDSLRITVQMQIDKFISAKPRSFVSPFILFVTAEMFDDPMLMEQRYNLLDSSIKNSIIGKNLLSFISYNKVGAVGTAAIDFTQPDTTGKPVTLSSFKGKYVLVDFWASWCGPCRAENPNVVKNYKSFKDKNFTVLGVSLDRPDGKANWLAAIQRDSLTWTHVSDLQFWNNAAAQAYRVQSIPFNILVDPNGKIIAKNLRGPELHSKLCEILGCN